MTDILSFAEAIDQAATVTKRPHVLLGNGFSIAYRPDSFAYGALLREATFEGAAGTRSVPSGTGIGLTTAKALARMYDLDLKVTSLGLCQGSTFVLCVPAVGELRR